MPSNKFSEAATDFSSGQNKHTRLLYAAFHFLLQINNSSQPLRLYCAIPTARTAPRRQRDRISNVFSIHIIVLALRRSFSVGIFEVLMILCRFPMVIRVVKAE